MIYSSSIRFSIWYSTSDFSDLCKLVNNEQQRDFLSIISKIEICQLKYPFHIIPRSVNLTHQLCTAISENSVQSLSLAILRLVSILNDEKNVKEKSNYAIPLKKLIKESNLPDWMCDIRNDIAHGSMPSRQFLNLCIEFCFDTLKEFWSPNLPSNQEENFSENDITKFLIKVYLKDMDARDFFSVLMNILKGKAFFDDILFILKSIFENFDENLKENPPTMNSKTCTILKIIQDIAAKRIDFVSFIEYCFLKSTDENMDFIFPFLFIFKTRLRKTMLKVNQSLCNSQVNKNANCPSFLKSLFKYKVQNKGPRQESSGKRVWKLNFDQNWHNVPLGNSL